MLSRFSHDLRRHTWTSHLGDVCKAVLYTAFSLEKIPAARVEIPDCRYALSVYLWTREYRIAVSSAGA